MPDNYTLLAIAMGLLLIGILVVYYGKQILELSDKLDTVAYRLLEMDILIGEMRVEVDRMKQVLVHNGEFNKGGAFDGDDERKG